VDGGERRKVSWATIIGNQDGTQVEQMEQVGERRLPGDIQYTLILDGMAYVVSVWFLRGYTDKDHVEFGVREEAFDEGDIVVEWPFPDADPCAGVGVDDHELFLGIERGMPCLQEVPYLRTIGCTGMEGWQVERMVLEAVYTDFCQRHLSTRGL